MQVHGKVPVGPWEAFLSVPGIAQHDRSQTDLHSEWMLVVGAAVDHLAPRPS